MDALRSWLSRASETSSRSYIEFKSEGKWILRVMENARGIEAPHVDEVFYGDTWEEAWEKVLSFISQRA